MPLVNSFFEARNRGEFSFSNLSLSMVNAPAQIDFDAIRAGDEEAGMEALLDGTAYFHELRHYHDLIGSVSGLHMFLEMTDLVDKFFHSLRNRTISLPLEPTGEFAPTIELYSSYRKFFSVVFGDGPESTLTAESVQGTDKDGRRYLKSEKFESLAPKIDINVPIIPAVRINPLTGKFEDRMVPLSMRSLLEHAATDLQFFIAIIGVGPKEAPDLEELRARAVRYHNAWSRLYRADFAPYTIVMTTASFRLKQLSPNREQTVEELVKAGVTLMAPPGSLIPLVQAALDVSGYFPVSSPEYYGWVFEHPGLALGHMLAAWKGVDDEKDNVALLNRLSRPLLNKTYTEFLEIYVDRVENKVESVLPPHLRPSAAKSDFIQMLREDVLADHLLLMKSKIEDLNVWFDPVRYIQNVHRFPRPPIVMTTDAAGFSDRLKSARIVIWTFLLAAMDHIVGQDRISCPVRETLPVIGGSLHFKDPNSPERQTNCKPFIASETCGQFNGEYLASQPRCHFVRVMKLLAEEWGIHLQPRRAS